MTSSHRSTGVTSPALLIIQHEQVSSAFSVSSVVMRILTTEDTEDTEIEGVASCRSEPHFTSELFRFAKA